MTRLAVAVLAILVCVPGACAPALREPPPVQSLAPPPSGAEVAQLLQKARDAWARRADPAQARAAESLFLEAAAAEDERRVDGILGAMRAKSFRIEREQDAAERERLATSAVQLGQWCERRAPESPGCDYALAVALGQQAREKPRTGEDAMKRMQELLRRAIAKDARLDRGGPHRVLALLLLRAPGWPMGPGDPESGLREARAAADLFPDYPHNALVLAEALAKNDQRDSAKAAYRRALTLADAARASGDPDADAWRSTALAALQ